MKPSLDEQLLTLVRSGNHDRGTLRRWGKKNGYLVSTIDNAVTRLILHEGRLKTDGVGRLVEIPAKEFKAVATRLEHVGPGVVKIHIYDPLEEIARSQQ